MVEGTSFRGLGRAILILLVLGTVRHGVAAPVDRPHPAGLGARPPIGYTIRGATRRRGRYPARPTSPRRSPA